MGGALGLEALIDDTVTLEDYIPSDASDLPTLAHNAYDELSELIPCINVADFRSNKGEIFRTARLSHFKQAVAEWGFFQVIGHGVEVTVFREFMALALIVFQMPLEKKLKARQVTRHSKGYDCGLTLSYKQWYESLLSLAHPDDFKAIIDNLSLLSEEDADKFKKLHSEICTAVEQLAFEILELLAEALDLPNASEFSQFWTPMERTSVRIAYYPKCDQPQLVLGAKPHSDPTLISILYQDLVGGLQILKGERWVACEPRADAFVVNIGDYLQVLSNDILPSIEHRVVLNKQQGRMSMAFFIQPNNECLFQPCPRLIDSEHPPRFRPFDTVELHSVSKDYNYKGKEGLSVFRVV